MAWQVIEPVLKHWTQTSERLYNYLPGSWGPNETRALFEKPYQSWRNEP